MATNMLPILLLGGAALFLMSRGGDEEEGVDGNGAGGEDDIVQSKECFEYMSRFPDEPLPEETNIVAVVTVGSPSFVQNQRQLIKETVLPECERIHKLRMIDILSSVKALSVPEMSAEMKVATGVSEAHLQAWLDQTKAEWESIASQVNISFLIGLKSSGQSSARVFLLTNLHAQIQQKLDEGGAAEFTDGWQDVMAVVGSEDSPSDIDLIVVDDSDASTIQAVKDALVDAEVTDERSALTPMGGFNVGAAGDTGSFLKRLVS